MNADAFRQYYEYHFYANRMIWYFVTQLSDEQYVRESDKDLFLWQILLHVVNHGTDHRAQILRSLREFGIETPSQDYVFFADENG